MNALIISKLPFMFAPFKAIIFPVSATIPPTIIAVLLLTWEAVNPNNPAIVGIIKAPEKMVNAISSDWIIEWTFIESTILKRPIISMMIFVFRIDGFFSRPLDK